VHTLQCVFNGGPHIGGSESGQRVQCQVSRVSAAAVTMAGDVADEDLAGAELMTSSATAGRFGDPRTSCGAD
jgi:hypothetical protein